MKKKKKKKTNHYIDNADFYQEMIEWKKVVNEAESMGEPRPPATSYIGECFLKIAEHLSYKPNFINYPYKEEMIGDGIENCIMYAHNFDPEKSKNPFSYFTQIIYYAFLRRIEKEKKQSYIKFRAMEMIDDGTLGNWFKENYFDKDSDKKSMSDYFMLSDDDIKKYTPKKRKTRKKKQTKEKKVNKKKASLNNILKDEQSENLSDK